MKKIFLGVITLCMSCQAFSQKSIQASSKVTNVTVYLQGASVTRTASATLPAGAGEVVFTGLTTNINDKTVQISGKGDFTILSVVYSLNYLQTRQKQDKQKLLEDSLQLLNASLATNLNTQATYNGMAELLNSNKSISGNNTSLNLDVLKATVDYYETKMLQIKNQLSDLAVKEKKIRDLIYAVQNELNDQNQKDNQPTGEITVQVTAKEAVNASFDFSYLETTAGWSPEYDIRADNVNSPIQLSYKANIYQNTGEDWDNVKLSLSTGNPTVNATGPILNPWYLAFYVPQPLTGYEEKSKAPLGTVQMDREDIKSISTHSLANSTTTANYTTVVQSQLAVVFDISIPYTVPSDGKNHMVSVQDYSLPATYEYYAIPKLDQDAFLTARVTDWGQYNLLSGNANIFFEGAYVGQSYIDANNTKDTLSLSLGRDKMIVVKREQVRDFTRTKFIGGKVKKTYAYDISVRNTKNVPISIRIEDQLPISQDKDIDVELEDGGGVQPDADTKAMKWIFNLQPNTEQKIRWSFSVQYPKDKVISGL